MCYYEDCKKIYNTKYSLIRHINSYHLDNKSYMCSSWSRGFYNKQCLVDHALICIQKDHSHVPKRMGILEDISYILDLQVHYLQPVPPIQLPILARIEKERQVPLHMAKLPIIGKLFENEYASQ